MLGTSLDQTQLKKTEAQLDALYKKYDNKSILTGGNSKTVDKTTTSVKKLNTSVKSASKSTEQFGSRMKTAISSTIQWTIAVGGLYAAINKIKDATEFTVGFDTALTEIAMVTSQTRAEVSDLKDEYLELGDALKVSSIELANSAVALFRQGLSAEQVNERLSEISKAAKVAGLSVEQVTKAITSTTNAMGVSAERTNDVLLKVASIAATDYQNISESLQKSAASFTAAGFELEQSAAAIATIQEVTQESASSIGTSLKTILARFNKVNESGEDNADVLNQIDKALQSVGVSLTDSTGQLREVDDVLNELAPQWDTLTKNQQAYLTTQIAGSRQANRFMVLMQSYNRMLEIQAQAYDSAGTTQEQYLKFQESIQGQLNELQVAWEKFYDSLVDEGVVSDFLDFAINAVNLLTELNESVGIGTIAMSGFITKLISLVVQLKATEAGIWGTFAASEALKASLTFGLTLAVTGLTTAWIKHNNRIKEAKRLYDEFEASDFETFEERYEIIQKTEKELAKLYEGEIKLLEKGKENLKNLEEGTAEYANQLDAISVLEDTLSDYLIVLDELGQYEKDAQQRDYASYMDNYIRTLADGSGVVREANKTYVSLSDAMEQFILDGELSEETINALIESGKLLSAVNGEDEDSILRLAKQYGLSTEDMYEFQIELTNKAIEQSKLRIKALQEELNAINTVISAMEAAGEEFGIQIEMQSMRALGNLADELQNLADLKQQVKDFEASISELGKSTKETGDEFEEFNDEIKAQTALLKQLESQQDAINDLIDLTVELIEKENELYKEQLEDRQEALKLAKEEAEMQKELSELNEDRAKLESELFKLRLDDSQNNNARILEIEQELADKDLAIKEQLDEDAYNSKIQVLDDEIDAVDDYLSKEGQIRQDAMDRINEAYRSGSEQLFEDLVRYNEIYGNSIEQDIVNAWQAASQAVKSYGGDLTSLSSISNQAIQAQMAINSASWHTASSQEERDALHSANAVLANQLSGGSATFNGGTGTWNIPTLPEVNSANMLPAMSMPSMSMPNISPTSGSNSTTIGSLITVQGNVDSNVMSRLESAASQVTSAMKNVTNMQGIQNIGIL